MNLKVAMFANFNFFRSTYKFILTEAPTSFVLFCYVVVLDLKNKNKTKTNHN